MILTRAARLLALGAVPALARFEDPTIIEGVPVYNYEKAHLARPNHPSAPRDRASFAEMWNNATLEKISEDEEIEWVIVLKDGVSDKQVDGVCKDPASHACLAEGHPDEGGEPVTGVRTSKKDFRKLLKHHKSEILHAEPNLPIYIPPTEVVIEPETKKKSAKKQQRLDASLQGKGQKSKLLQSQRGLHAHPREKFVRRRRSQLTPPTWGLDRIDSKKSSGNFDSKYDPKFDGHGVHVYVLDTGVKMDHHDFALPGGKSRVVPTLEMWASEVMECSGPSDITCAVDRMGHGTHCAGSAAGEKSGVAKGATVHGVKVLGDDGRGSDLGVAMAVDWIMRKGDKPAIMSMSLGRQGKSQVMADVLKKATGSGITVVVAAGNENEDACGNSPAHVPEVITVGAVDKEDTRASFSNYGQCLDIFAPGKDILSAYYSGVVKYGTMSGTSMACPHVSGFAAMLLQADPTLKPEQVRSLIKGDGVPGVIGAGPGSPDLMLYVDPNATDFPIPKPTTTTTTTTPKPKSPGNGPSRRRRRRKGKSGTNGQKPARRRRRRAVRRRRKQATGA